MTIADPHDHLFREALSNPADAAALLRAVLPAALSAELALDELTGEPGTFVDEELRLSHSDVLFKTRLRGREVFVYVLFEHKSGPDRWTVLQLLRYLVRIWERQLTSEPPPRTLTPVIPVIVHHGERQWTSPASFHELFDAELMATGELGPLTPSYRALVDDLTKLTDEALEARAMSDFGMLALWALRDGRGGAAKIQAGLRRLAWALRRVWAGPDGKRAMTLMVTYIFGVSPDLEPAALGETLRELVPGTEELVMTIAEKLRQEGLRQGREEGVRTAIEALCDVLGIELSATRRTALATMSPAELTSVLDGLRQHRSWPEH